MLAIVLIACVIIIFPLYINVYFIFILDDKKAYFSINIFGFIKLLSGYIEVENKNLVVHLNKNKAVIYQITSYELMKKKFKPLRDYHILKFNSNIDIGIAESTMSAVTICFILNYIEQFINWLIFNRKPYVINNNKFNIYEGKDVFNAYISCTIVLNLLMIIISIIKIIMEKMFYAISTRRG